VSRARFAPAAVFALARAPEDLPHDLRLPSAAWGVLFSVTGRHTVAQIGAALGMERAPLEEALAALLERGLVVERALSLAEYLAAAASLDGAAPVNLGSFLRARGGEIHGPSDPAPAPRGAAIPAAQGSSADDARLAGDGLGASFDELPFEPLPLDAPEDSVMPAPPPAAPARALSLRGLIDALIAHAGTTDGGQLDVYRTFLRVEPALLRRNGITTLRMEDDRVVRDPELVAAIVASAAETLGGAVPESVYVR
jgi:hypothetical protein